MSKKCKKCNLVCFPSENICKRCNSEEFFVSTVSKLGTPEIPFGKYLICFLIAVAIEFVALLPALAGLGFSKASNGLGVLLFFLHLPTIAITMLLTNLTGNTELFLLTPVLQVIFWTIVIIYRLPNK